jgi:hypothetical protein
MKESTIRLARNAGAAACAILNLPFWDCILRLRVVPGTDRGWTTEALIVNAFSSKISERVRSRSGLTLTCAAGTLGVPMGLQPEGEVSLYDAAINAS